MHLCIFNLTSIQFMTYSKYITYFEFITNHGLSHTRECSLFIQLDFFLQLLNVRRQLFCNV